MGFNATLPTLAFTIEDEESPYNGVQFRARSMTVKQYTQFIKDMASFQSLKNMENPTEEGLEKAMSFFSLFTPYLIDWNLEQEDPVTEEMVPVPATLDGMQVIDPLLAAFIVTTWMEKAVGVPGPLGKASTSGGSMVQEASIPMEALASSLPS